MGEDRSDDGRIGEDEAHRLIARAAELDSARAQLVSISDVRTAALEAGISATAFDEALREFQAVLGRKSAESVAERVRANVLALLATWGGMTIIVRTVDLFHLGDGAVTVAIVSSLVAGTLLAHRLGARVARFALAALAVSIGSEMLLDLIAGHPVVHGNGAHFALFAAGFIGVGVGALLGRGRNAGSSSSAEAQSPAPNETERASPPAAPGRELLRLRPAG